MHAAEILLGLLLAVAVLAMLAGKLGVPYPILLVLGGLALGFIPGMPRIELAPDLIFLLFLPPLIYSGALFSSLRDLRANLRPITMLAIGLVITTMIVVVVHAVGAMPWNSFASDAFAESDITQSPLTSTSPCSLKASKGGSCIASRAGE